MAVISGLSKFNLKGVVVRQFFRLSGFWRQVKMVFLHTLGSKGHGARGAAKVLLGGQEAGASRR